MGPYVRLEYLLHPLKTYIDFHHICFEFFAPKMAPPHGIKLMNKVALIITSIANQSHPVLNQFAREARDHNVDFIVVGDTKSPADFSLDGCDFYSIERQNSLGYNVAKILPTRHYARKNIGYLAAIRNGIDVIIETDDDNIPLENFWTTRHPSQSAKLIENAGWVNVYRYFSDLNIWPRGFNLENLQDKVPQPEDLKPIYAPIQQGLADDNPDVDAIYRLTLPLPVTFHQGESIAIGKSSICPFNSQNTTWFKEAFPLLYLPSYCSFRMTDIWRSFIAQRIAWTCGWPILFHQSTVRQERNDHRLLKDFEDEISGYLNNANIVDTLSALRLRDGVENIFENLERCYAALTEKGYIGHEEMPLVRAWISDLTS